MPSIRLEHSIPSELISSRRMRGLILAALQHVGKEAKAYAEGSHDTFVSFTVEWKVQTTYSGGDMQVSVTTDNEIYGYLNDGTDERWAVMRSPFESKTQPGQIQAGPGVRNYKNGYYTRIRGRQAMMERNMQAMPGIEGRDFVGMIEEVMLPRLIDAIDDAVERGIE